MPHSPSAAGANDALYRRVAFALIPFLFVCYVVAMVDRLNVGYAKLQFMADLHFDESVFGMAAGVLYVGYILFEVPSNLMLERVGLAVTMLRIMTLWGVFTMAMAFAADRWSFYAIRFMIGAAEAGFFPGVLFYLTLWFPNAWRARITSLFALAVPLSGVLAAPLSSAIMAGMAGLGGLAGWRWLFLIEGAPAIVLGFVAWADLAGSTKLSALPVRREKRAIAADLAAEAGAPGAAAISPKPCATVAPTSSLSSISPSTRPRAFSCCGSQRCCATPERMICVKSAGAARRCSSPARSAWRRSAGAPTAYKNAAGIWSARVLWPGRRWPLFRSPPIARRRRCFSSPSRRSAMFAYLALFWTVPTVVFGAGARAGGIALVSAIGASGSALSPTFIGWTQTLTGSLFGAIATLAAVFVVSLAVFCRLCADATAGDF